MGYFVGKIIEFYSGTGCIPPNSRCYCYAVSGDSLCVIFQQPILGSCELKIHIDVIKKHGTIIVERK